MFHRTSYGSAKITLIAAHKLHIKAQIKTLQKHNCVNMKAQKIVNVKTNSPKHTNASTIQYMSVNTMMVQTDSQHVEDSLI